MQVWIRETNESEPPLTRRNPETCRQNQGRFHLLGSVRRLLGYWADGGRRIGGVKLIRAHMRNPVVPMSRETHKRHQPRGKSTDAEHWDGPTRSSDEGW